MYDGYNFEVYCDRELCSKVITKDNKVHIERYILHPLKQIFYKDALNRPEESDTAAKVMDRRADAL